MRVLRRIVSVVTALAVAALCASCYSHFPHFSEEYLQSAFTDAARWKFSTFFFCPSDRIQITPSFGPPPPVEISIEDNGIGIQPDFLPYVFDRFRQADAAITRRYDQRGVSGVRCSHR